MCILQSITSVNLSLVLDAVRLPSQTAPSEQQSIFSMASDELSKKLQSRFAAVEDPGPKPEPEQSPVRAKTREPEPDNSDSSSELSAKLTRRQDINDGNAAPRLTRVFNPYTEFKEFSRKQIKDMEAMFKR